MSPLISVIVPVYNVEDYLDRCVESIVNQTYKNLEIILVDDGSTDSSGKKCDAWKAKDSRILVIHKENGGQAEARNFGLDLSTGDYIGFVDSDDYIDVSMFYVLINIILDNNCETVECSMMRFSNQEDECFIKGTNQVVVFNHEEAIEDFVLERHLQCTVPNMLVKSNIAKNIKFDVGKINEDILWPYRVYVRSDKVIYIDSTLYFYYQRHDSTMNSTYSEKRFDGLDALETRAELIKEEYPNLYGIALRNYVGSCMYQYQYLCRQQRTEKYIIYKKTLHKRFCDVDKAAVSQGLSLKYKMWYTMFRLFPDFTCKVRNTLKIGL